MDKTEFAAAMAAWLADNGGAYNMAHTGREIDEAVSAVAGKTTVLVAASAPANLPDNAVCFIDPDLGGG